MYELINHEQLDLPIIDIRVLEYADIQYCISISIYKYSIVETECNLIKYISLGSQAG